MPTPNNIKNKDTDKRSINKTTKDKTTNDKTTNDKTTKSNDKKVALIQSKRVFNSELRKEYLKVKKDQVKTSNDPDTIFKYIKKCAEDGTRFLVLHIDDETLSGVIPKLDSKLKKSSKFRKSLEPMIMAITLSTANAVRDQVESTRYLKGLLTYTVSPMSEVLDTLEDGISSSPENREPEPKNKTILVVFSDESTLLLKQANEHFIDDETSSVKKCKVSELELTLANLDSSKVEYVHAFITSKEDSIKFCDTIAASGYSRPVTLVNFDEKFNDPESMIKLQSNVDNIKCISSGVQENIQPERYPKLTNVTAVERQAAYLTENGEALALLPLWSNPCTAENFNSVTRRWNGEFHSTNCWSGISYEGGAVLSGNAVFGYRWQPRFGDRYTGPCRTRSRFSNACVNVSYGRR
jgi:hypothetical protein